MGIEDVWRVVEQARAGQPETAPADQVAESMVRVLSAWAPADIAAFEQPLWDLLTASYRGDLWAAAAIINGGASADGFDYFRGWLIAQGRDTFERALADPDSLAGHAAVIAAADDGARLESEDVLTVASQAYERVTGASELPDRDFVIEFPELDPAWDLDDDDADTTQMRRRLPRLVALFGYDDE
ncbi:DUF4240 domain-containing protein [Dactylosporangium cerinum]|uniref:DUF4240 domain-containing protein n=1 Tax=Dactylosporangium cerinum TaxID=1434730 RepID=A0ABV9W303_9ACTN